MEILNDFNTSVEKALGEIYPDWRKLNGLIICGTHSPQNIEWYIGEIEAARVSGLPFLGICFGHQLAAIEYARNVLGKDATSEEFVDIYPGTDLLVRKRKEGLKVGLHEGETWWNNYEVVPGFESIWKKPHNFITVQYHPEYQSSKDRPHPILVRFLQNAGAKVAMPVVPDFRTTRGFTSEDLGH